MTTPDVFVPLPPAAYLRFHPHHPAAQHRHQERLRSFSSRLGLPAPTLYVDDNRPAHQIPPHLEELVQAVVDGFHRVLLIPGPWVFSPDEAKARRIAGVLTYAGCRRILTLPAPHQRPSHRRVILPADDPALHTRGKA
ncbi:hypothetical protein ABT234_01495 [Streptomyces sp. NPDC001586]|uniref:hypothetical protein n=1 Tax=unclassified Streptomyces TaxID=2593676 RepID=UPI003326D87E